MRASVLRLWAKTLPNGLSEETNGAIRFDEAIDESVAEIVPTYLQRESQFRDRFFGMLGHDLRTPINAIHLSARALVDGGGLKEENQVKMALRILNSCQNLDRMVRDILDFTRGRFGEPMHVTRSPADLGVILHDIVDELQYANPNVIIDWAASGDLRGEWDRERLSQVISNLVTNAIQHGNAQHVSVTAGNENDRVLIEVHNQGPAISQDRLATIFNPLRQERHSNQGHAGLGLGLFICKEIVKAHGGTISATSSGCGYHLCHAPDQTRGFWSRQCESAIDSDRSANTKARARRIDLSRNQGMVLSRKSYELRTTMSLARLLASQGRRDETRAMLTEIYNWFTEGFDTEDLKEA